MNALRACDGCFNFLRYNHKVKQDLLDSQSTQSFSDSKAATPESSDVDIVNSYKIKSDVDIMNSYRIKLAKRGEQLDAMNIKVLVVSLSLLSSLVSLAFLFR